MNSSQNNSAITEFRHQAITATNPQMKSFQGGQKQFPDNLQEEEKDQIAQRLDNQEFKEAQQNGHQFEERGGTPQMEFEGANQEEYPAEIALDKKSKVVYMGKHIHSKVKKMVKNQQKITQQIENIIVSKKNEKAKSRFDSNMLPSFLNYKSRMESNQEEPESSPQVSQFYVTNDGSLTCRVCLERIPNLITETQKSDAAVCSPCACTGTLRLMHIACLKEWIKNKGSVQCEICHSQYESQWVIWAKENNLLRSTTETETEEDGQDLLDMNFKKLIIAISLIILGVAFFIGLEFDTNQDIPQSLFKDHQGITLKVFIITVALLFIGFVYFWQSCQLGFRRGAIQKIDRVNNAINNNLQEQVTTIWSFSLLKDIEKVKIRNEIEQRIQQFRQDKARDMPPSQRMFLEKPSKQGFESESSRTEEET